MQFSTQPILRILNRGAICADSRWFLAILLFGLCLWGWIDVRSRGFYHPDQPDEHRTDMTVYTEAGAAFFDGREPYEVTNCRGWGYLYPPLFALLMAPLHSLASQDQVMVWYVISVLFLWGVYRELTRLVGCVCAEDGPARQWWAAWYPWLGIAAFCVAFMPTLNCLQRGQVGILKLYLLLLGFRLILRGRRWPAWIGGGIVLSLPIVLKLMPLLPVAFLIFVELVNCWRLRREQPAAGRVATRCLLSTTAGLLLGLLLFLLFVPAALVGWQANLRHLTTWSQSTFHKVVDGDVEERSGNSHGQRNQSLQNAAYRLGNLTAHVFGGGPDDRLAERMPPPPLAMDSPIAETMLIAARLAILAALALIGIRLGRLGDRLSLATAFALGNIAMLVISPVARAHYFMLVAPATIFLPWWLACRGRRRAAVVMAVTPILLIDLHYFAMPITGRIGLLGLGLTAWLLAAFVLVQRGGPASEKAVKRTTAECAAAVPAAAASAALRA